MNDKHHPVAMPDKLRADNPVGNCPESGPPLEQDQIWIKLSNATNDSFPGPGKNRIQDEFCRRLERLLAGIFVAYAWIQPAGELAGEGNYMYLVVA